MKGIYSKDAIKNIVEPLKAISSVFTNNSVHVVYENDENNIVISAVNPKKSVYVIYELNAKKIIKDYSAPMKEVGIWDVKQFINILGKYENNIYNDDVEISFEQNRMKITCGKEKTDYYTAQLQLFNEYKGNIRKLKTETLKEACSFVLEGIDLKKLLTSIIVFDEQDEFILTGKKGTKELYVRLASGVSTICNRNEIILDNIDIKETFNMKFPKIDIKGLLSCNDKFSFTVYTGAKNILSSSYSKEFYDMKFYFATLIE